MRCKKGNQKGKQNPKKNQQKKPKGSLGRSLLTAGLGGLGALLGPTGARVGASLGDWGANVLGMGDYEVKHNTLLEGNGVPRVHATRKGVTISHREFLGDITGSTTFVTRNYAINPGSQTTFPWLSQIAAMFQSYRIKGMLFEFNSTSADALNSVNTALGTVIMSTQYNVALPPLVNKAEMEQYEYTVSGRPSRNLTHVIECDPSLQVMEHLFTRTGTLSAGSDYQFYDWGNFQLATVGMQAEATIGELWVSYEIEFLKPRIASGGCWPGDFTRVNNGPYSGTAPLGIIQTNPLGNLGVTITSSGSGFDRIYFPPSISAGRFLITVRWKFSTPALMSTFTRTLVNLTSLPSWQLNTFGAVTSPEPNAVNSTTAVTYSEIVSVNGYSAVGSYVTMGAGQVPSASAQFVDIIIVALPLSDNPF